MTRKPTAAPKPWKGKPAKPAAKAPSKPVGGRKVAAKATSQPADEAPPAPPRTVEEIADKHGGLPIEDDPEQPPVSGDAIDAILDIQADDAPAMNGKTIDYEVSKLLHPEDNADAYHGDFGPAMLSDPLVWFRIDGQARLSKAYQIGQGFANALGVQIEIVGPSLETVAILLPQPPAPPPPPGPRRYIRADERDWTIKPVAERGANVGINGLLDRIEKARGDADKLRAFVGEFAGSLGTKEDIKRASTYYKHAARYLHALLAEAQGVTRSA